MGRTQGPYREEFPVGTAVRIVDAEELNAFAKSWRYHHPVTEEQFQFAGKLASVEDVSFYHGGDELYQLRGLPGLWHEGCLRAAVETA
jgi:hypothetical protein